MNIDQVRKKSSILAIRNIKRAIELIDKKIERATKRGHYHVIIRFNEKKKAVPWFWPLPYLSKRNVLQIIKEEPKIVGVVFDYYESLGFTFSIPKVNLRSNEPPVWSLKDVVRIYWYPEIDNWSSQLTVSSEDNRLRHLVQTGRAPAAVIKSKGEKQ